MWFLSARKARRSPAPRSQRGTFRPRLEALEDRCLLSAGALDPTFGSGGLLTGPSFTAGAEAVVVQPDGKIVTGGAGTVAGKHLSSPAFALARYNANGTLDSSFGNNGIVTTLAGSAVGAIEVISGLALQSDGKIVAVGMAWVNQTKNAPAYVAFTVARYNPNGSLDTTFGNGSGIVLTNVSNTTFQYTTAVVIQADGKIDVAGYSSIGSWGSADFTLIRYNANGTLDTSFGPSHNGIVVTPNFDNTGDEAQGLAIQANGFDIVLAGRTGYVTNSNSNSEMVVARYTPSGMLDTSFGTNGIVMMAPSGFTEAHGFGVLVQNTDIVVAGYSGNASGAYPLTLARLNSNGQLDTTFGSSGFAIDQNISMLGTVNTMVSHDAIALHANGDLLATGVALNSAKGSADICVAAFLPNGALDTTFGVGGTTTADFAGGTDYAHAIAIQPDGRIVVAGGTTPPGSSTTNVALARFLPPDTKIGSFTANPNPVTAGGSVTLTTSNILNSNPTSTITQVAFYLDANNDGILEPGTDTLLGYGTNNSGTWTFTSSTAFSLTSGTYTLFAQAVDSNGVFSDPVAISLRVI